MCDRRGAGVGSAETVAGVWASGSAARPTDIGRQANGSEANTQRNKTSGAGRVAIMIFIGILATEGETRLRM